MARIDELAKKVLEQVEDEDRAFKLYTEMAASADQLMLYSIATDLREIASQEYYHREVLLGVLGQLKQLHDEAVAEKGAEAGRPFPQTYGDWVNLAIDIKERDPGSAYEVNLAMGRITGDLPGADEAKRQLVRKAGELGIT